MRWVTLASQVHSHNSLLTIALKRPAGDTVQFAEFVERNIRLHHIRYVSSSSDGQQFSSSNSTPQSHHHELRPQSAASWIRRSLADSIRSRRPYSVNVLLGGYDEATSTPHLYWIDYLGTMANVPYAAHGYGAYFALSLLDR